VIPIEGKLAISTVPMILRILSEPTVVVTFKGYAPVVQAENSSDGSKGMLFIGSKSLTEGIEPLRARNGGRFTSLVIRLHKESAERYAKYVVEEVTKVYS